MVSPAATRKARSFLYSRHKRGFKIHPKKFAASSRELGVGFHTLMRFIALQYARGAQQGTFRQDNIRQAAGGDKS